MTNPGYVMIDFTGLNLNSSSKQTITGIYDKCEAAFATGKPIFVVNANMSGAACTPVSVVAWKEGDDFIATGHVLRVLVEDDDGVTVTNLVAG